MFRVLLSASQLLLWERNLQSNLKREKNQTIFLVQTQSHHFEQATDFFSGTVNSFTGSLMLIKGSLWASSGLVLQNGLQNKNTRGNSMEYKISHLGELLFLSRPAPS